MKFRITEENGNNILKYFLKSILTIALVIGSYFCFTSEKKEIVQKETQVTQSYKRTTIKEDDGFKKFLEYIGLFLLVVAAWQWRKEIGFDSFGFISKQPEVKPTNPEDRVNDEGDIPPEPTPPDILPPILKFEQSTSGKFESFKFNENLKKILNIMNKTPNSITNTTIISNKLGVTRHTAEKYLYELLKKKLIRKDTYPGSRGSIYSLSNSLDNRSIDYFINKTLSKREIISDYRYVRLKNKYEIDAIIKTSKSNYLIELKYISKYNRNIINRGIYQLLKIEEEIDIEPLSLVLLIVTNKEEIDKINIKEFEIKSNLRIILIDKNEITKPNNV